MIQDERGTVERAKCVHNMRSFIRNEETAIRGNSTVFKKLWMFIEGVVDGSNTPETKVKSNRGRKRKDAGDSEDFLAPTSSGKKGKTES